MINNSLVNDWANEFNFTESSKKAAACAINMLYEVTIHTTNNLNINALRMLPPYINLAEEIILNRLYPYATDKEISTLRGLDTELYDGKAVGVGDKYINLQAEIALVLYNKRGAEGEMVRNESGINRTFAAASVPQELLNRIIPHGSIVK